MIPLPHPILIAMAGLPGCGKSTLAARLSERLDAAVLDKDRVRAAVFPPGEIEYSRRQDDLVFEMLYQTAAFLLDKGRSVILDGRPFTQRDQVERLERFARQQGVPMAVLLCVCPDEVARRRLESDAASGAHPAANRTWEHYLRSKAQADPLALPHLEIDTARDVDTCAREALAYIETVAGSQEEKGCKPN